jgi:hypothetical protein
VPFCPAWSALHPIAAFLIQHPPFQAALDMPNWFAAVSSLTGSRAKKFAITEKSRCDFSLSAASADSELFFIPAGSAFNFEGRLARLETDNVLHRLSDYTARNVKYLIQVTPRFGVECKIYPC